MTEREGFEPPEACTSIAFKATAFDHSAISPKIGKLYSSRSGCLPSLLPGAHTSSLAISSEDVVYCSRMNSALNIGIWSLYCKGKDIFLELSRSGSQTGLSGYSRPE